MEPAKNAYGNEYNQQYPQQYPQQPFGGQGMPIGGENIHMGQPIYGAPLQYPSNQMPPVYQPPQNFGMPPPPIIGPGNVVIVGIK